MIDEIKQFINEQVDIKVEERLKEYTDYKSKYHSLLNNIMADIKNEYNSSKISDDNTVTRYISEQLMYGFIDLLDDFSYSYKNDLSKEDFEFIANNCIIKEE